MYRLNLCLSLCLIAHLFAATVSSLNVTAPVQNETIDITKPYKARWIPTTSDPTELSIDIVNATSNNTYVLDNVARAVKTVNGSFLIDWPSAVPSTTNEYQLIFLSYLSGGFVSRSNTFTLTIPAGEIRPVNSTQGPSGPSATDAATPSTNGGGLSTGAKAAIGVVVPVVVLLLLAAAYFLYRRRRKQKLQVSNDEAQEAVPKAELESKGGAIGVLHKLRSELGSTREKPRQRHELPAKNQLPIELPASEPPAVELDASDFKISESGKRFLPDKELDVGSASRGTDTVAESTDETQSGPIAVSEASTAYERQQRLSQQPKASSDISSVVSSPTIGSAKRSESGFQQALGDIISRKLDGEEP